MATDFKQMMESRNGKIETFKRPEYTFHSNFGKQILCSDTTTTSGRYYCTPDGEHYPSITTVLSKSKPQKDVDGLNRWRQQVGKEKAQAITTDAANRGTKLHKLVEEFIVGAPWEGGTFKIKEPREAGMFKQVYPLLGRIGEIHIIEQPLYSKILKVAGRVDLIGTFDGKLSVIDFKTSSKEKREDWIFDYLLQETFYSVAFGALFPEKISQIVTIMAVEETGQPQLFVKNPTEYVPALVERLKVYHSKCAI